MKKLYIYCGVMFALVAACLVLVLLQPMLFPLDEAAQVGNSPGKVESDKSPGTMLMEAKAKNPDVYAWIHIPGTSVDYPVLQSPTSDTYYLKRDKEGHYLSAGSIMSEHTYNGTDFEDPVTILYGQCMKSGTMFGSLQTYYSSETGLLNHPMIEIYLPDRKLEYKVFAAVPYGSRHIPYHFDFSNQAEWETFFKNIFSIRSFNASVISDRKPEYGDKVLILSTFLKGDSTQRYLVLAKLK